MVFQQMSNNSGEYHEERYYSRNYWYERKTKPKPNFIALIHLLKVTNCVTASYSDTFLLQSNPIVTKNCTSSQFIAFVVPMKQAIKAI